MSVFEGKMECFLEKVNELDIFGSNQGIMKSVAHGAGSAGPCKKFIQSNDWYGALVYIMRDPNHQILKS